ncbi:hypothetical protein GJA_1564 [Janthinobacterium agaricidamnosum NBRC 102515 = DSM 9628]|uniref:Uncharacterized protein n=1 Tax=Janthinobacterium agaricidamnosum NBRC 102515 = DSM 9628 TaxID=1349767 RepID=W0V4K7_9BURK|nr:hypothetical protein GJA_1564 [Janthinobacterium agaricidamnosum NBRC 102515 = DSM 9628]
MVGQSKGRRARGGVACAGPWSPIIRGPGWQAQALARCPGFRRQAV